MTIDFIERAVRQWNYPWDLTPGADSPIVVVNPPKTCSVKVESDPSGANILLDRVARGTTPNTLQLTQGQSYALSLKMENYQPHDEKIDCDSREVSATLVEKKAKITVQYTGDYMACRLGVTIRIGDKSFRPTGNQYPVLGVPLGDQDYSINGQIACTTGVCQVSGSGSVEVRDGGVYNIGWVNVAIRYMPSRAAASISALREALSSL